MTNLTRELSQAEQLKLADARQTRGSLLRYENARKGEISADDTVRHLLAMCSRKGVQMPAAHEPWTRAIHTATTWNYVPEPIAQLKFERKGKEIANKDISHWFTVLEASASIATEGRNPIKFKIDPVTEQLWLGEVKAAPPIYKRFIDTLAVAAQMEITMYGRQWWNRD